MTREQERYLNNLYESGIRSAFASERYLMRAFKLNIHQARTVVLEFLTKKRAAKWLGL